MAVINFEDYFRLLEEWKGIVEIANADINVRGNANSQIDAIIIELKKPFAERNCNIILAHLNELKKVKGLTKYVGGSLNTIMAVCGS